MPHTEETINKRIARYRNLAGYTQESAAVALGVNKNSYARMERTGTPKPEMLKKLSGLFNVSAETILYGERDENLTVTETKPTQLKDPAFDFKTPEPLMLTTNEKNAIKLCRTLTPKQRGELLDLIARYVENAKDEDD